MIDFLIASWTNYYCLDWASMVTGLLGLWLLGNQNKWGFILTLVSLMFASYVSFVAMQSGFLVANALQCIIICRGWYIWYKREKHEKT
jgi:nicotinamide riboside transporter PnuC